MAPSNQRRLAPVRMAPIGVPVPARRDAVHAAPFTPLRALSQGEAVWRA